MAEPTYIFEGGLVYTMVNGQVVSSVKESDFDPNNPHHPIEGEIEMPEVPPEMQREQEAEERALNDGQIWENLPEAMKQRYREMGDTGPPISDNPDFENLSSTQTVTTPNGLTGRVLARVPSLWGEEVTVRFENGVIKKIPVDQRLTFAAAEETDADKTAAESLEERLTAHYERDKLSLVARGRELKTIEREAGAKVAGASDAEAVELAKISTQAKYELAEVTAALEAIVSGEQEAYEAPAPITNLPEVTQSSTNGNDASWLDKVHIDMITEANSVDYQQLMDEGPERFVASLDPAQLADAATTRIMASREIESKTAGADANQQEAYRRMWLARVEQQRKEALNSYKGKVAEKTASSEESHPDESLFL